ncbi:MAG: hypothetical protein ACTSX8_07970 [Alphaproteobacteria bacterium]
MFGKTNFAGRVRCSRCGVLLSFTLMTIASTRKGLANRCADRQLCNWRRKRQDEARQLGFNFDNGTAMRFIGVDYGPNPSQAVTCIVNIDERGKWSIEATK